MQKNRTQDIGNWWINPKEKAYMGQFGNVTDLENKGIFPGKYDTESSLRKDLNPEKVEAIEVKEADYQYSFLSDEYFYGIKNDNTEVIAIVTDEKKIIPVRNGIGKYHLKTRTGVVVYETGDVKDFTVGSDGSITVNYNGSGETDNVFASSATYNFKEGCISVETDLDIIYDTSVQLYNTSVGSSYINKPNKVISHIVMDWLYPENNDCVYKELDAILTDEVYGDYVMHVSYRDPNSNHKILALDVRYGNYLVGLTDTERGKKACAKFDISCTKNVPESSYLGLFKGRNMSFAAGIASIEKNNNTTMFMGKELQLNLNVTNIVKRDINFCLKYNIMDHYNTCVDAAIFYENELKAGEQANHNIELTLPKYGMYYLNLYVVCGDEEYRECYPFCMLEKFDFKHRDENPFGICLTHTMSRGQGKSTCDIMDKMGLSIVRLSRCYDNRDFINLAKEYGVKRYAYGITWNKTADGIEKWKESVRNYLKEFPETSYFLMANEVDSKCKANYEKSTRFLNDTFKPYTFDPAYEVVSKEFPEKLPNAIWQSNCHGTIEWLEAYQECGIWDKSEYIDIHTYSSPNGPDKCYSNTYYSQHENTFSNEYAMERWKRAKKRYGEKRLFVGETGYPTPAYCSDTKEIDFRTGADFNVRIVLFLLEAGCEDILFYCMMDSTSFFIGSSEWNEMYFGAVFGYDHYGVYMPKPWMPAYANLVRRFDGHKKVSFFDKYEESEFGTLRAFKVEKEDGEFAVLWSNVYMLPNTTVEGRVNKVERIPMPAWEDRWIETEIREFDAVGDTVTVVDIMGNLKEIKAENGKVKIEVSGSPIYVYGIC